MALTTDDRIESAPRVIDSQTADPTVARHRILDDDAVGDSAPAAASGRNRR